LEDEVTFWQNQSSGLAIFLAESHARILRLPADFNETVVLANRFHVKPLLQLSTNNGIFYVLALSQNQIRLLQGTRHTIDEVSLAEEEIPTSLREALKYDDRQKQLQAHASREGGALMFHGHGAEHEPKVDILRYFNRLDDGLNELLEGERAPLVLAGVDYLHPIYHEASEYPTLVKEGVEGNPEAWSNEELHAKAWEIVEPIFARQQEEAAAAFRELVGTGRASADLREIVSAAYQGRVNMALISLDDHLWGTYDPETDQVEQEDEQSAENQDLLDLVAAYTLQNGGKVFAVPQSEVPDGAPAAAVYRY
jgi:hypothetical protein